MSESGRAVFLSYASQDAAAAKRLCDTLRAAGVEVWFDQSELRGGDAWDAKIRRQIRECALFVPLISANTNARPEGYFRLEWKLAVDRSHLLADDHPFLFPVVIGDVADASARVPDRFREVQWTRLRLDETPGELTARIVRLLAPSQEPEARESARNVAPARDDGKKSPPWLRHAWSVLGLILALVFALRPLWRPARPHAPAPGIAGAANPAAEAAPGGEAAALAERAFALTQKLSFTQEDLATAEVLAQRATEQGPDLARGWGVRAWVQACFMMRNWDLSEKRLQATQSFANRALVLNADDVEALNALCQVYEKQELALEQEKLARRVLGLRPENFRAHMSLGRALVRLGRVEEAHVVLREAVEHEPENVLAHYELANSYVGIGYQTSLPSEADIAATLEQLDASLARQPFTSSLLAKAVLLAGRKGDLAGLRAQLDQLELMPLAERSSDRAVMIAMLGGLYERNASRVLGAAALTTRTYFEDFISPMPKAWLTALAYRLDGKENSARAEWQNAETVLHQRLRDQPGDELLRGQLATTLAWLGRDDEATREIQPVEAVWAERANLESLNALARYYAARGEAAKAVPYLRRVLGHTSFATDRLLPLDPWWDKLRGQPEFEALLQETARGPAKTEAAIDPRSVAVLAFANLSDDKGNEYFSEGISEELLNVLAKIPGLKVSARTSAFYFKGKEVPIPEIARQLGVAYVVEGSVRKSGDKVRIAAQLIKATDGFHVWSDTFTRDLKDIFAVQDEIAALIAQNLSVKMGMGPAEAHRAVNPEAHRLVLEGRHYWNLRTAEDFARAEAAFAKAIELDPDFAQAHAGLADVLVTKAVYDAYEGSNAASAPLALVEAERAVALDPKLAEAYPAKGVQLTCEGRLTEAEQVFRQAIALNPNYALAHHWFALVLELQGRLDVALSEIERAIQLDPLSVAAISTRARFLMSAGRYAEALAGYDQALAMRSNYLFIQGDRALILQGLGRTGDALALAKAVVAEPAPNRRWISDVEVVYLFRQAGHQREADDAAARQLARLPADSFLRGFILAAQGRTADAMPFLERVPPNMRAILYWNPIWDPWRDDPRFQQLLVKLGCAQEYKVAREVLARMLPSRSTPR